MHENELAVYFFDKYPVNERHILIIPKRHTIIYFACTKEEKQAIEDLLIHGKKYLEATYQPDGSNIGANCGIQAGQTIFLCHIHLIPRYKGDSENPTDGVRV